MNAKLVLSHATVGLVSFAMGGIAAYFALQKKFDREVDAEIEKVRTWAKDEIKKRDANSKAIIEHGIYEGIASSYDTSEKASRRPVDAPRIDSADPDKESVNQMMAELESPHEDDSEEVDDEPDDPAESMFDPYIGPKVFDQDDMIHVPDTSSKYQPYIISEEEFEMTQLGYNKVSVTYYAGDDTLSDEDESIMNLEVVGEENLGCFEEDINIMYVRNDHLGIDFEVIKNEGLYSQDVLGMDPEESKPKRRVRNDL